MDVVQHSEVKPFPLADTASLKTGRSASWLSLQVEKTNTPKRYASAGAINSGLSKQLAGQGLLSTKRPAELKKAKPIKPIDFDAADIVKKCQDLVINGQKILRPQNESELIPYMKKITSALEQSAPDVPIRFQYGEGQVLKLNPKMLGKGGNTLVYEVINESGDKSGKVIKFTRPDKKSLNSVIKDIEYSKFWLESPLPDSFSVPKYTYCDPATMFRIAEKSDGVPLTELLLRVGIFGFDRDDPANPTTYFNVGRMRDKSVSEHLKPLAEAVVDMLDTMKENPEHYTSLSPDNIHVTFEPCDQDAADNIGTGRITKVELIDIGVNKNRKEQYKDLRSFEGYLGFMFSTYRLGRYLSDKSTGQGVEKMTECQNSSPWPVIQAVL